MNFKSYTLMVDEQYPDTTLLKRIAEQEVCRHGSDSFAYQYHVQFKEERFFLLAIDVDNLKYSETVYDKEAAIEKENPRKRFELEYEDQCFACYDTAKNELYLSDTQRKPAVKLLFSNYVKENQKVFIRERISSIEEFAAVVKAITRVKYTQTRNLINSKPNGLFTQAYDPYGLETPDKLISTLEYDAGTGAKKLIQKLREYFGEGSSHEIDSIEVLGVDDEGFEQLFSLEKVVKKIPINVETDCDGRYDTDEVFTPLLRKLKEQ